MIVNRPRHKQSGNEIFAPILAGTSCATSMSPPPATSTLPWIVSTSILLQKSADVTKFKVEVFAIMLSMFFPTFRVEFDLYSHDNLRRMVPGSQQKVGPCLPGRLKVAYSIFHACNCFLQHVFLEIEFVFF